MRRCWMLSLLFLGLMTRNSFSEGLMGARFPSLSPDGTRIAFSYMGDLWRVSSEGGDAVRLTNHAAYDREPVWSPDGEWIAFSSNRYGHEDVFIISGRGGAVRRLTFHSANDVATDFSPDGRWILFHSNRASQSGLYKVPVDGGTPVPVLETCWSWPYYGRISRDTGSLIFSSGMENNYWWRRGYRGSNSTQLWVLDAEGRVRNLLTHESNSFWPHWGPDGRVYAVSDREFENSNIWVMEKDGSNARAVTSFTDGDVRWLSVAEKEPLAVYERQFGIWITDLTTGESRPVHITAPAEPVENRTFFVNNEPVSEYRLSPDGKKIAAVVRGDVFILGTSGGYARNVTRSPWRERDVIWNGDSHVIYVSDVDANPNLYTVPALGDRPPRQLTNLPGDVLNPRLSPDGRWVAYFHGSRELRLISPEGKDDRLLLEAEFGGRTAGDFAWSPDSRFLAVTVRQNANTDILAVNIENAGTVVLTNTAYDESDPQWSPDGRFILFRSNRYGHSFPEFTGKWDLYQVDLQLRPPEFSETEFEKLFRDAGKKPEPEDKTGKTAKPVVISLIDPDRQTRTVTNTLGNDYDYSISPKDTHTVYFVSNTNEKRHLWTVNLKDKNRPVSPFMPEISDLQSLQFDAGGDCLYYLSSGRIGRLNVKARKNEPVSFETRIRVDKTADYEQMLAELYYTLQYYFYDSGHHEADWKALYKQFRPVLKQVREDRDFNDYVNEMIGYLNSSHTGMNIPSPRKTEEPTAHLGVVWDVSTHPVRVGRIIKNGPIWDRRDSVSVGDELLSVNGQAAEPGANLWALFNGKLDKRVRVTLMSQRFGHEITLDLKPVSSAQESRLVLEEWIDSRREAVQKATRDRVAYIYMRAMGYGDLQRFLRELERDAVPRDGLILDLRYNFGGNVHDRVLGALMKPVYAKWKIRGLSETRQSTFGFADKPVVLLINEVTLSDGEMTANGFKALNRGTIVGNTTYGWLIFTTGVRLMNGSTFRLPFWGCYTLDGRNLETGGGVVPDVMVVNTLAHELNGEDLQLEKAIEIIQQQIGRK